MKISSFPVKIKSLCLELPGKDFFGARWGWNFVQVFTSAGN